MPPRPVSHQRAALPVPGLPRGNGVRPMRDLHGPRRVRHCGQVGLLLCTALSGLILQSLCFEGTAGPRDVHRWLPGQTFGGLVDRASCKVQPPAAPVLLSIRRFNQRHTPQHRMQLVRPRITAMHMLQVRLVAADGTGFRMPGRGGGGDAQGVEAVVQASKADIVCCDMRLPRQCVASAPATNYCRPAPCRRRPPTPSCPCSSCCRCWS